MYRKIIFLLLLSMLFTVTVSAADDYITETEDGMRRIPYNSALRSATRNLPGITAFDDLISDMTDMRYQLHDLREFRRRQGTASREEMIRLDRQIGDLSAQINTMREAQNMVRVGTEASMRASIIAIANTELDIKLLEASLAHGRIELENAKLRLNAGLISESAVQDADLALQAQEATLAALAVTLETERQTLNRIIQRPIAGNYYVGFERELIELPVLTDQFIRRTVARQPNVRQAEIARGRARAALNDQDAAFGTPERQARQRAYDQAVREYNDARRALETAMRNTHNNLTALLHSNDSLEIDLQRAKDRLNTVELNYQAGLATPFDIEAAQLEILRAEISIEKNLNTFWNLQFIFENPFLAAL